MKKLILIFLAPLIFSCGGNSTEESESDNLLENLTLTVDTLIVDGGEDIFNLSMGIRSLDLSEDKKRLFYFENNPAILVEVDLEKLKLIGKTDFEREGPDGIGGFVDKIEIGPNDQIFAMGITEMGLFDLTGKKIKNLKIIPSGVSPELAENFRGLYMNSIYDFEENRIYCWPDFEFSQNEVLYLIDVDSESAKSVTLPEMDVVRKYSIRAVENGKHMYSPQQVYLLKHQNKILISCSAMSNLYELNPEEQTLNSIEINHNIVPNRLSGEVNINVTSEQAFQEEMKKVNVQIIYHKMEWEPTRKIFLRLGFKVFMGETREDPNIHEVYLFAYDADFNLLGESKIDGLKTFPTNYFWKEGKLWSDVNVDDELGFAVFTFNF